MKNKKKLLVAAVAASLTLSVVGCGINMSDMLQIIQPQNPGQSTAKSSLDTKTAPDQPKADGSAAAQ